MSSRGSHPASVDHSPSPVSLAADHSGSVRGPDDTPAQTPTKGKRVRFSPPIQIYSLKVCCRVVCAHRRDLHIGFGAVS